MKLKVGDLVAFKKYENMTDEEQAGISKDSFPEFGKISEMSNDGKRFFIEDEPYMFSQKSIDYIIVKGVTDGHFILQEDQYKMYVIDSKTLSLDKSKSKIYNSRNEANDEAADMHLNTWEVIPYGD